LKQRKVRRTALAVALALQAAFWTAPAAGQTLLGDWFDRRDANGDGFLTIEEWQRAREQRLQKIDTDGNGAISRLEFLAYERRQAEARAERLFKRLDTNGDGAISAEERGVALSRRFQLIDQDGDGRVSTVDLRNARARLRESAEE
jgi:hypothetical protein